MKIHLEKRKHFVPREKCLRYQWVQNKDTIKGNTESDSEIQVEKLKTGINTKGDMGLAGITN